MQKALSPTLFWRDPNAACDLVRTRGGEGLLILALGFFLSQRSPRESGLEHASCANVTIAAAALSTSLAQQLRFAGESSSYHQKVRYWVPVGARHKYLRARKVLGQGHAQMRVVEQATVLRLGRAGHAGDARLGPEVCLTQATPLNENLDCAALSATITRWMRCAAGTY